MREPMRAFGIAIIAAILMAGAAQAQTLDEVRDRGYLNCGVNTGLAGFATPNEEGDWEGFDVDFCRAMAAAIFDDPTAIRFRPLTAQERFTALQSGEIDILSRNTTWTFTRDVSVGVEFVGVNYYDGQGFMVPASLGVESALDLDGARICIQTGTTTELNLADYFRANDMSYETIVIQTGEEARRNYLAEACDAYTTDISGLAAIRSTLPDPDAHVILPEVISKEPLGPVVRQGDQQWTDLARWVLNAMITAE
jgi:general L-amino acid transport system substrate-binding protein